MRGLLPSLSVNNPWKTSSFVWGFEGFLFAVEEELVLLLDAMPAAGSSLAAKGILWSQEGWLGWPAVQRFGMFGCWNKGCFHVISIHVLLAFRWTSTISEPFTPENMKCFVRAIGMQGCLQALLFWGLTIFVSNSLVYFCWRQEVLGSFLSGCWVVFFF